jgi:hypothetical protein
MTTDTPNIDKYVRILQLISDIFSPQHNVTIGNQENDIYWLNLYHY